MHDLQITCFSRNSVDQLPSLNGVCKTLTKSVQKLREKYSKLAIAFGRAISYFLNFISKTSWAYLFYDDWQLYFFSLLSYFNCILQEQNFIFTQYRWEMTYEYLFLNSKIENFCSGWPHHSSSLFPIFLEMATSDCSETQNRPFPSFFTSPHSCC